MDGIGSLGNSEAIFKLYAKKDPPENSLQNPWMDISLECIWGGLSLFQNDPI